MTDELVRRIDVLERELRELKEVLGPVIRDEQAKQLAAKHWREHYADADRREPAGV